MCCGTGNSVFCSLTRLVLHSWRMHRLVELKDFSTLQSKLGLHLKTGGSTICYSTTTGCIWLDFLLMETSSALYVA